MFYVAIGNTGELAGSLGVKQWLELNLFVSRLFVVEYA
jgi:hypothetical protein